jgi:CheY-like chemotaxis protein
VQRQQRLNCTVMVGSTRHPGAAAQLPRPIQPAALLDALDRLLAESPPMSAEVQKVWEQLAALRGRAPTQPPAAPSALPAPAQALADPLADAPAPALSQPEAGARAAAHRGRALLVGSPGAGAALLARTLAPLGLELEQATSGSQAVQRLQHEVYEFVFLATGAASDEAGDDAAMDGFQTCKLLQRLPPAQPVAPPPTLVLLLASDAVLDCLRAERAGADAWLAPPWDEAALGRIVEERAQWLRSVTRQTD